jgi:Carboxypeptidase regulatory-like domain
MRLQASAATAATLWFVAALTAGAAAQLGGVGGAGQKAGGAVSGAGSAISGIGGTVRGAVGGAVGGVGGAGGAATGGLGAAGGSLGGLRAGNGASMQFSGPAGTIGTSAGGGGGIFGGASLNGGNFNAPAQLFQPNSTASAAVQLERKQQLKGTLLGVNGSTVTVQQPDGAKRTVQAGPEIASALASYVGKPIYLRSADGVHVTSFVGREDVTRGIVTDLAGDLVTYASPNGEMHSVVLAAGGVSKLQLRPGASVLAVSKDFGATASVAPLNLAPASSLADVYIGNVRSVAGNTVRLGLGQGQQSFGVTPSTAATLSALVGKTVALDVPDGTHVKSLLTNATVARLAENARGQVKTNAATASVVNATNGRLTLQLPNGDLRSYRGNAAALHTSARVPVTITPLDQTHVRVRSGTHVANMADANACVTVNAACRGAMQGNVVAATPTSVSVQYPNGDVATFVGNAGGLAATAGVPVTVTPLNAVSARLQTHAQAANLVDATACVTINSGCRAMPGTVTAVHNGSVAVTLPDGQKLDLAGSNAGLSVNTPVFVQPLDNTHALVSAGAQAAELANAGACTAVNAVCPGNGGGAPGAGTSGVALAAAGSPAASSVSGGATPNTANPAGSSGGANASAGTPLANGANSAACASVNNTNCAQPRTAAGVSTHAARSTANVGSGATPNTANPGGSSGGGNVAGGSTAAGNPNGSGCVSVNGSNCAPGSGAANGGGAAGGPSAGVSTSRGGTVGTMGVNSAGATAGTGNGTAGGNVAAGRGGMSTQARAAGNTVAANSNGAGAGGGSGNGAGGGNGGNGNGSNGGTGSGGSNSGGGNNGSGNSGAGNSGGGGNGGGSNGDGGGSNGAGGNDATGAVGLAAKVVSVAQIGAVDRATTCSQDGQIATGVADIASGKPIANARVQLAGPISVAWRTDAEGSLRFLKMPTGTYRVTASAPGYQPVESPAFNVDCVQAANLAFKLAAIRAAAAAGSVRALPAAKTSRSYATVGRAPRLARVAVKKVASHHAICAAKHVASGNERHRRTLAGARSHREVICSR